MFALRTRHDPFFDMFDTAAQNVHEGAKALLDMLENWVDVPGKVRRLKNYEHAGDEHTHRILEKLAKTFITPLDREDIQRMGTRLDDVLDAMDAAANRMMLYDVGQPTEDAKAFARVLVKATGLLVQGFTLLRDLKKPETIISTCVEVHTQENEGDRLMQHALAGLFEGAQDPRDIIKWKDIYQILENATDRCEDVADVLQTIVVKHA
jgi:predicted phosphate transport protein (TIGR00153 family)